MGRNKIYVETFRPETFYHIYNRTNNRELLFRNEENHHYFLERYQSYLFPFAKTYAYALMHNHFHIIISTRSIESVSEYLSSLNPSKISKIQKRFIENPEEYYHELLYKQFSKFFASYAQSVNKEWNRKGNLFHRPFKRVLIDNEAHFSYLIYYTHLNCIKHKISEDYLTYKWSSYTSILSEKPTYLEREYVLDWFSGKKAFIEYHNQNHQFNDDFELLEV